MNILQRYERVVTLIVVYFSLMVVGESAPRPAAPPVIFATFAEPGDGEVELPIWARSIRSQGGKFSKCPVWILVPNNVNKLTNLTRHELADLHVRLIPCRVPENALRFPFAAKVYGAAAAESLALGKTEILVWMDRDNIIINEPAAFRLSQAKVLGVRPVMHNLIGPLWDAPPDPFWQTIYRICNVPAESLFPMLTPVDSVAIKPYFNAGHLVLRPERGILRTWRDIFQQWYMEPDLRSFYRQNNLYAVFVHQAILSGVILANVQVEEIEKLPETYNYPLLLMNKMPARRRAQLLDALTTVRYDYYQRSQSWRGLLNSTKPLSEWPALPFRYKPLNMLLLVSNQYGAGFYLTCDEFEKNGWEVTIAGTADTLKPCGFLHRCAPRPLLPEIKLNEITNLSAWDGLVLMPSSIWYQTEPFSEIIGDSTALEVIREANRQTLPIFSICSASRILAAAQIIRDRKIVANPRFKDEYRQAGADWLGSDHAPVKDGNLVTGVRDQFYNFSNCLAFSDLVERGQQHGLRHTYPTHDFIFSAPADFNDPSIGWAGIYGGFGADGARSIAPTNDGGYYLTGYTFSHGNRNADLLVVKIDSIGNLVWSRTCGGVGAEYGNNGVTDGENFLAVGYTTSRGSGGKDVYLVRLNPKGKVIGENCFGGKGNEVGTGIVRVRDGYVISGFTDSQGAGEQDLLLLKTDARGRLLWQRTYGGAKFEISNTLFVTPEGDLVIGATTGTFGGKNSDCWLLKTDSAGREIWRRNYGTTMASPFNKTETPTFDWCNGITPTPDGGIALVGSTNCRDLMNVLVMKADADGNLLWTQTYGKSEFYDYGHGICAVPNGDLIVTGTTKDIDRNNDVYVIRLDREGKMIWEKRIGSRGSDWGSSVRITQTGKILIAGQTTSRGFGAFDMALWILKNP